MIDITFRRASLEDAEALAAFAARSYRETFAGTVPDAEMARFLSHSYGTEAQRAELSHPAMTTWVAEEGGELAAFFQLQASRPYVVDGIEGSVEIKRFYVDARLHGRGIAARLMDRAKSEARRLGSPALWLGVWEENARAQSFYRKMGFSVVGTQPFVTGDVVQSDFVMWCPLPAG